YDFYEFDNETIDIDDIKAEAAKSSDSRNVKYYPLSGDDHKYVTWSMRYEDIDNIDTNNSFLIESMSEDNSTWIQPTKAQWLKMNNGCLVLSVAEESNFDEITGISTNDDVLIFNVTYAYAADDDEFATDNDKVTTTEVKVIASEGKVTILNAAGKKVVVNNILGQTIANTVLSSDNASIAAPKGIVVVAVEGEEAVKAIVK
ncbi:MAG: DUF6383 domain-containing protein, partial [Tannerellaceae bacterium]|nr:DUF6383 domain-containing protein [Tannerellaceae bacterium]